MTTFVAMLWRDAHVARRNLIQLAFQILVQPMMFVFVFGRVMTTSGFMPSAYRALLLPGIIAISMVMAGMWAVAMPLVVEFQWAREIDDRLLAPMELEWLAIEKIVAGTIQAVVAGLVVIPAAWLVMGNVSISGAHLGLFILVALLVALLASAFGLALGCTVGQQQIGLMSSLVVAPMIFFGCTYYPWSALAGFPLLQSFVLVNPLVYASEGLRSALVPAAPHLSQSAILGGLVLFDALFVAVGLWQFRHKALT